MSDIHVNNINTKKIKNESGDRLPLKIRKLGMLGLFIVSTIPFMTGCETSYNQYYGDEPLEQQAHFSEKEKETGTIYVGPGMTNESLEELEVDNYNNIEEVYSSF